VRVEFLTKYQLNGRQVSNPVQYKHTAISVNKSANVNNIYKRSISKIENILLESFS